jgi:hypothetical protein
LIFHNCLLCLVVAAGFLCSCYLIENGLKIVGRLSYVSGPAGVGKVVQHMAGPFAIVAEICCQKIREEKDFEHAEHDEQLNEDDFPEGAANHHGAKAIPVEGVNLSRKSGHLDVPLVLS